MWLLDVKDLVVAAGLGTFGANLFVGRLPEEPDAALALLDYGGRPPDLAHGGKTRRYPRFQAVCRDGDAASARTRIEALWSLFLGTKGWDQTQLTVNGTTYEVVIPLGEPYVLTFDSSARAVLACNFELRWSMP